MSERFCQCCLKPLSSRSWNAKYCRTWCEPHPGFELKCTGCGEVKGYDEYYDYRGVHDDGRLVTKCKSCRTAEGERIVSKGSCVICGDGIKRKYNTVTCGKPECWAENGRRKVKLRRML